MHVNMQMFGHNSTREHNKIAVCSCGSNDYEYHTYQGRLQQLCCMGDSNTTGRIVSNVISKMGKALGRDLISTEFNSPYMLFCWKIQCKNTGGLAHIFTGWFFTSVNVWQGI